MKKLIILLLSLLLSSFAFAKNMPVYTNSINVKGIGLVSLPEEFTVYKAPDFNSKVVTKFNWGKSASAIYEEYSDNFVIYEPDKKIAFMSVISDNDEPGWFEICYDQDDNLTGWVFLEKYEFYSWYSFFIKYGKENGVYFLKDLPVQEKKLRSQPNKDAKIIGSFNNVKTARVQIFDGDWVLLRLYDYENRLKIGWFQWKTEEGKFRLFPVVK